jgi:hypothetical protein
MALHNQFFYAGMIRKYTVAFGNLFNSLHIARFVDGVETGRERVPLSYGPKQKYIYRTEQNPELNERYAIKLPRISFEMIEMTYDTTRKTPSTNKLRSETIVNNSKPFAYNAVPYNFVFDVNIMTKNVDDSLQIVEQIVPFFTPDYTMTINAIPALDHKLDIPIVLNSITTADNWDSNFDERRDIVWNMQFTLRGFLYAPIRDSKIILQAEWDLSGFEGETFASGIETERDD